MQLIIFSLYLILRAYVQTFDMMGCKVLGWKLNKGLLEKMCTLSVPYGMDGGTLFEGPYFVLFIKRRPFLNLD